VRWPWQPKPKPFEPCHPSCPVRVERRIAEVEEMGPLEFWLPGEPVPAAVEEMKVQQIAEMRRIVAEEFPPPCWRCPANREKAMAS
jgi:hypothetical protein